MEQIIVEQLSTTFAIQFRLEDALGSSLIDFVILVFDSGWGVERNEVLG
jgi:hypothetical protein